MSTIKEFMRNEFYESLYKPFLSKYVALLDIICLMDGERIEVNLNEGKLDDGLYYLERRNASLFFYRAGHFRKILIINNDGIFSYTPNQLKKAKGVSGGLIIKTHQWQRFFAEK